MQALHQILANEVPVLVMTSKNRYCTLLYIFSESFSPIPAQQGYFFDRLENNISTFVKPCSKKITEWIKSLKAGKQQVFLLTNSFIDYTNLLMNYAVG